MNLQEISTKIKTNEEFFANCTTYFAALRKSGKTDDGFEDEFFYTMPAISEKI